VEEKHHVVPQFLLERFASGGQLAMRARDGGKVLRTSPERAAKEGGFYRLEQEVTVPAADVMDAYDTLASDPGLRSRIIEIDGERARLIPDALESFLGLIEGRAKPAIGTMIDVGPPPTDSEDRLYVALLVALQHTRGRGFRNQIDELFRAHMSLEMTRNPEETVRRWREHEARSDQARIADPLAHVLESLDGVRLNDDPKLGLLVELAEMLASRVFTMTWRILCFDSPEVLTSDEGLGLWAPKHRDRHADPVAFGSANIIFFSLDANHILQLVRSGRPEAVVPGTATRLRQSNDSVASGAERWVFGHPDSTTIGDVVAGPRPVMHSETVAVERDGDLVRELIRTYRA
jgi:hypothetical protein